MSTRMRQRRSVDGLASPGTSMWEGRAFGGIVLAAFLLYGIGSSITDQAVGIGLVVANSIGVSVAGLIGFRLVRVARHDVGVSYLVARVAEAVLLLGGILMAEFANRDGSAHSGYLLAMIALSVGSLPFLWTLREGGWIPRWLATWGTYGYAALAIGALAELATDRSVAVILAVPGGLFELVLGFRLIWRGFDLPVSSQVSDAGRRTRRSRSSRGASQPSPK